MCNHSFKVKVESKTLGTSYYIDAPCGRCSECVKRRQNDWKLRLCEECKNWKHLYFFTLTYAPENLPYNINEETGEALSTARKSDLQSWLKLMRERFQRSHGGDRLQMKYFICAEYGPRGTKRPHYHGLIMTDVDYFDIAPLFRWWSMFKGFVKWKKVVPTSASPDIREHRSKCANYVSKYCCKGEFASRFDDIEAGLIEKAWTICSKNIGASYIDEMSTWHLPPWFKCAQIDGSFTEEQVWSLFLNAESPIIAEIDLILSRNKVYDGSHGYKMPKYYRDRIYGIKKYDKRIITDERHKQMPFPRLSCESCPRWREKAHFARFYESPVSILQGTKVQKSVRYSHENFVSVAMRVRLLQQHDFEYRREFSAIKSMHLALSDAEVIRQMEADKCAAALYRESYATSQLSEFYTANMFRHRELNGLND